MTQIIKVSKSNIDVLGTAGTVPNNLIFDSDLNTFKIVATGTSVGTINAYTTGTLIVAHGLGYLPPVTGFIRKNSGTIICAPSGSVPLLYGDFVLKSISADGTNVFFEIYNGNATGTIYTRYYAFEAPLT